MNTSTDLESNVQPSPARSRASILARFYEARGLIGKDLVRQSLIVAGILLLALFYYGGLVIASKNGYSTSFPRGNFIAAFWPLLWIIALTLGSTAMGEEFESRTSDLLYTLPIPYRKMILSKIISGTILIIVAGVSLTALTNVMWKLVTAPIQEHPFLDIFSDVPSELLQRVLILPAIYFTGLAMSLLLRGKVLFSTVLSVILFISFLFLYSHVIHFFTGGNYSFSRTVLSDKPVVQSSLGFSITWSVIMLLIAFRACGVILTFPSFSSSSLIQERNESFGIRISRDMISIRSFFLEKSLFLKIGGASLALQLIAMIRFDRALDSVLFFCLSVSSIVIFGMVACPKEEREGAVGFLDTLPRSFLLFQFNRFRGLLVFAVLSFIVGAIGFTIQIEEPFNLAILGQAPAIVCMYTAIILSILLLSWFSRYCFSSILISFIASCAISLPWAYFTLHLTGSNQGLYISIPPSSIKFLIADTIWTLMILLLFPIVYILSILHYSNFRNLSEGKRALVWLLAFSLLYTWGIFLLQLIPSDCFAIRAMLQELKG